MARKKDPFKMAQVKIIKPGSGDCPAHHEVISMQDNGHELGICKRCGQERLYIPAYQRERRRYAETT
jgi:hypothetical protein